MPYTVNEVASAIDNNVRTGLKGVTNVSYSIEQLEAEVLIERARILATISKQPLFSVDGFTQELNEIKVDQATLAKTQISAPTAPERLHFRMPALINALKEDAVNYIGPPRRDGMGWRVYIGADHVLHKYRQASSNQPYVYIDPVVGEDGWIDCWILNYVGVLEYIATSAVFSDPGAVLTFGLQSEQTVSLAAPDEYAEEIIKKMSTKYIQYYRQYRAEIQVNDQTDKS